MKSVADKELLERGWSVLEGVFDDDECRSLMDRCVRDMVGGVHASVQGPDSRMHVALPLSPEVAAMIAKVVSSFPDLETSVEGRQHITELAALFVFPGAAPQALHYAHTFTDKVSVSFFVNLAATSKESGAFRIAKEGKRVLYVENNRLLFPDGLGAQNDAFEVLEIDAGSITAFNSQCPHQGGPNRTRDRIRPALYFTISDPGIDGLVYPLHPENVPLRLDHFRPFTEDRTPILLNRIGIACPPLSEKTVQITYDGMPHMTIDTEEPYELALFRELHPFGNGPGTAKEIAEAIDAPVSKVIEILNSLLASGIVLSKAADGTDPLVSQSASEYVIGAESEEEDADGFVDPFK